MESIMQPVLLWFICLLFFIIIKLYGKIQYYKSQAEVQQDLYEEVLIKQLRQEIKVLTKVLLNKKKQKVVPSIPVDDVTITQE